MVPAARHRHLDEPDSALHGDRQFCACAVFGLWLLARKLPLLFRKREDAGPGPTASLFAAAPEPAMASGPAWQGTISQATRAAATGSAVKLNYKPATTAASDHIFIGDGDVCAACGNAHIADPSALGDDFNWKTAWSAIFRWACAHARAR